MLLRPPGLRENFGFFCFIGISNGFAILCSLLFGFIGFFGISNGFLTFLTIGPPGSPRPEARGLRAEASGQMPETGGQMTVYDDV